MLQQEFLKAEKLAKEYDQADLNAMKAAYDKKVARTALLGLVSLILLLFEEWAVKKVAPALLGSEPLGAAMIVLPGTGLFLYFFLSKRFTDARSRVALALELKRRESAAASKKDG